MSDNQPANSNASKDSKEVLTIFSFVMMGCGSIGTLFLAWFAITSPGPSSKRAVLTIRDSGGATVWLGLFRSCAVRPPQRYLCTPFRFNPSYNFSVLGVGAPIQILDTPAPFLRGIVWLTTSLTIAILPYVLWLIFRKKIGLQPQADWDTGLVFVLVALEVIASLFGAVNFWFLDLLFEKIGQHFNVITRLLHYPQFTASTGTLFQLAYGAYVLIVITWGLTMWEVYEIATQKPPAPPPAPAPAQNAPPAPQTLLQNLSTIWQGVNSLASTIVQFRSKAPQETPVNQ